MSSVESVPIFVIVLKQLRAYTKWGDYSRVVRAYPLWVIFLIKNAKKHQKKKNEKKRETNLDVDFSSEV